MDVLTLLLLLSLVIWVCIHAFRKTTSHKGMANYKLPPGPPGLPIFGNLFHLQENVHESLAKLSRTYGPLMLLKLGSKTTIVVSSSEVAKEVLQRNDIAISSRPVPDAARALDHHELSVLWLPASSQWRSLRRICKEQLFSGKKLDASQGLRQEKVRELCYFVTQCCISGRAVSFSEVAFITTLNFISNTFFSTNFGNYDSNSSQELKEIVWGLMKNLGAPNLSDFVPIVMRLDLQRIKRQSEIYNGKLLEIFDNIINQRLEERKASSTPLVRHDLLETLLDLNQQNDAEWSLKHIKTLACGTDTNSVTVEWALAELLRNPEKMAKARDELREVIGQNAIVRESDISRLPYLQAVVKETFRLHPAGTLIARKVQDDLEVNGYIVPKNAQILINIWGIGRDPILWLEPNSFMPERFLASEIDVRGQHFELIPFGSGRRICLGLPLADRMVHLMLASLLHNFDWKLTEGITPERMDMTEKFGITVSKAVPLKAIPVKS